MFWIAGAHVVTPDAVLPEAAVGVEEGRIIEIAASPRGRGVVLAAHGRYLLPGLIDMHSDAIEQEAMPRPGTVWPLEVALTQLDKKLPGHGITTVYHSVSMSGGLDVRADDVVVDLVRAMGAFDRALVRNRVHLRYEIANLAGLSVAQQLIAGGAAHLLSFMDHTPGQGQYTDPEQYGYYIRKTFGLAAADIDAVIAERQRLRALVDEQALAALAAGARDRGLALASHDDDTPAKVEAQAGLGVGISEFPITMEAARRARSLGMHVVVGAPNILRGGSHNGNLSARDVIAAGCADMICSDYYPAAVLLAVWRLVDEGVLDLPAAVRLATGNVAAALGAHDLGSIAPGKRADLILVDCPAGQRPLVTDAFVDGRRVYSVTYAGEARRQEVR